MLCLGKNPDLHRSQESYRVGHVGSFGKAGRASVNAVNVKEERKTNDIVDTSTK